MKIQVKCLSFKISLINATPTKWSIFKCLLRRDIITRDLNLMDLVTNGLGRVSKQFYLNLTFGGVTGERTALGHFDNHETVAKIENLVELVFEFPGSEFRGRNYTLVVPCLNF